MWGRCKDDRDFFLTYPYLIKKGLLTGIDRLTENCVKLKNKVMLFSYPVFLLLELVSEAGDDIIVYVFSYS